MATQTLLIADGARARILVAFDSGDEGPDFVERLSLANPEASMKGDELFRGSRSQARASRAGTGSTYRLDDGRQAHRDESAKRFAKEVARVFSEFVAAHSVKSAVVVAEAHFLGLLRPVLRRSAPKGLELEDLAEDLSRHSLSRLRSVLTKKGVLSPRRPSPDAYRPRGRVPASPAKAKKPAASAPRRKSKRT